MMQPRFHTRINTDHIKHVLEERRRQCIGESFRVTPSRQPASYGGKA